MPEGREGGLVPEYLWALLRSHGKLAGAGHRATGRITNGCGHELEMATFRRQAPLLRTLRREFVVPSPFACANLCVEDACSNNYCRHIEVWDRWILPAPPDVLDHVGKQGADGVPGDNSVPASDAGFTVMGTCPGFTDAGFLAGRRRDERRREPEWFLGAKPRS